MVGTHCMASSSADYPNIGKSTFLYRQAFIFDLLVLGMVFLTNVLAWNQSAISHTFLISWTFAIVFVSGIKLTLFYRHYHAHHEASNSSFDKTKLWYRFFLSTTALTGILLGIGGIFFRVPDVQLGYILFPTALAGLSLSAAVLFSSCFPAFLLFTFFSMLPFGFYAFFTDSAEGITLAIADLIFLLFVIFAAHKLHLFTLGFLHLQNHILSIVKFMDLNRSKLVELQDQSQVTNFSPLSSGLSPTKSYQLLESMVEAGTQELLNAYQEVRQNKERLELAITASNLGLWDWDLVSDHVYYQNFEGILGYKEDEEPGFMAHLQSLVHPEDFPLVRHAMADHLKGKTRFYLVEYRVKHKSGKWIWVEDRGKVVEWQNKRAKRLIGTHRDISVNKDTTEQLQLAATVFDNISEAIFILDAELNFISVNNYFTTITGYTLTDVYHCSIMDYRHVPESVKAQYEEIHNHLNRYGFWQGELLERRKNGDTYPQWLQINAIYDDKNNIRQYVGIFSDLTTRKESEEQLRYLATYDSITGLANRSLFKNRLHAAINHARQNHSKLALLYIDLDRFKPINDTYGHEFGDKILSAAAERLISVMPSADTISRLGSDEFTVILDNYISSSQVAELCEKLIKTMKAPFIINNIEIALGCSIGVSEYPRNAKELQTMLNQADSAMYQSKRLGGNSYHFFTGNLQTYTLDKVKLETQLRKAIFEDEIVVYFQPKLNLVSNTIDSVEALVRWDHPTDGMLTPDNFVPIAEETGLVSAIGEVVIGKVCQQLIDWRNKGLGSIKVSINLSAQQIHKGDMAKVIGNILDKYQIDANLLEVELTESILMEDVHETVASLNKIRAMGISILLDDFGTGYSSLSYLKKFPIDVLKIDKSFVEDIDTDPDDAAIVKAIIAMAHSLDLSVIAEGVERNEHLAFLRAHGCDGVQGHLISEPLNGANMAELLLKQKSAANAG